MGNLKELRPRFFKKASYSGKLAQDTLAQLWNLAELPEEALNYITLRGAEPVMPSSFAIGTAAQSSIAAAALAAVEIGLLRGSRPQHVTVDMLHAAQECRSFYKIATAAPVHPATLTGLYQCGDGRWLHLNADFAHHRDGVLNLLGFAPGVAIRDETLQRALRRWHASDFEEVAAAAGVPVAVMRSFDEWDAHPQGVAVAGLPVLTIERIGDADPRPWPKYSFDAHPLKHLRVLDLTRIIAGPVCGRALAAYGADVMLINAPHLPNIDAIADTSRGKLSAHVDLDTAHGRIALGALLRSTHIFLQSYHPGGLAARGFGPEDVARIRPGIVYVSLSAYGHRGLWAHRRGFDSLVQTATGLGHAEAKAAGQDVPKLLPLRILAHASGYLMVFGALAALARQRIDGGSWHVRVSLAQTAHWLRGLGRVAGGLRCPMPPIVGLLEPQFCPFGELYTVRHSAQFSATPAKWTRPSSPPGTHAAMWPSS
jgi:crotonobetainyl-CoA:carnitine CoA-transferase CaiB-like acyl-CoA transferase